MTHLSGHKFASHIVPLQTITQKFLDRDLHVVVRYLSGNGGQVLVFYLALWAGKIVRARRFSRERVGIVICLLSAAHF